MVVLLFFVVVFVARVDDNDDGSRVSLEFVEPAVVAAVAASAAAASAVAAESVSMQ